MKKIKQLDTIKSTTMFLIDEDIEAKFKEQTTESAEFLKEAMAHIDTKEGLSTFIRNNKESIEMLITVLGISGEKLKRVVTMLRVQKGYTFASEWDEKRLQKEMSSSENIMEEYCELFLNGRNLDKYKQLIPQYILDDFCIDSEVMERISNVDILAKFYKKKKFTAYTAQYTAAYVKRVKACVENIISPLGFNLQSGEIDGVGKDLLYFTNDEKYIILTCNYSLTTGAGQTKYYKTKVKPIYDNIRKKDNIIMVNMLDGAGWVARSADFKKIFNDCNYYTNLQKIDSISELTKEFFNIQ